MEDRFTEHQRKAGRSTSPLKKLKSAQNLANWRERERVRKESISFVESLAIMKQEIDDHISGVKKINSTKENGDE